MANRRGMKHPPVRTTLTGTTVNRLQRRADQFGTEDIDGLIQCVLTRLDTLEECLGSGTTQVPIMSASDSLPTGDPDLQELSALLE
ncbi:hypothetical protein [Halomicronema sp. CCY15110]|uniref:hypothetical protein n=1 Tax=Halomicronema sp. CCY15110 TaxID=2767773 RepID=UPI00195240F5|nr:hypothetical protein [Halomicronema sp. CCY15110]